MDNLKTLNKNLYNLFNIFFKNGNNIENMFLILFNIFLILESILHFFYIELGKHNSKNNLDKKSLETMYNSLKNTHYNLIRTFSSQYLIKERYTYLKLLDNISNYKSSNINNYNISFI